MQMLTVCSEIFSICSSNKLVLVGKVEYFQRLSRCSFCINCHPRNLLEDHILKQISAFRLCRVENSCYFHILVLEADGKWDGWCWFVLPLNRGNLSSAWPCVCSVFIAMYSCSPSVIEHHGLIFILLSMSYFYEMPLFYLFSVTFLSIQFNLVCVVCIYIFKQCAAYTSLCWGSFFFLNHCHLWQANHPVHFQIVTGDSTSSLTQLPMPSMLPVLSSWLWLFRGKMWAMRYWMLCWRGTLALWNCFLQYIIHN